MKEYVKFVVRFSHVFFVSTCCAHHPEDVVDIRKEIEEDAKRDDDEGEYSTVIDEPITM
jgi:hypothetical protein